MLVKFVDQFSGFRHVLIQWLPVAKVGLVGMTAELVS